MWQLSSSFGSCRQQFSSDLIQLNMADTLTLHLNKQKQHVMIRAAIMADWFDLVQGVVDLFSFMSIQKRVMASICIRSLCEHVRVLIQTNGGSLDPRACSTACPLIAIYILEKSFISNSCHYLSPPPDPSAHLTLRLTSMTDLISDVQMGSYVQGSLYMLFIFIFLGFYIKLHM